MNTTLSKKKETPKKSPLRSLKHFIGYRLQGSEGDLGKVTDFLIDDQKFGVRYLVAKTGGWFSSAEVLVSPRQLKSPVETNDLSALSVELSKADIKNCPPLDEDAPVSRRYELEHARYYKHQPYWTGGNFWGTGHMAYLPNDPAPADIYEHEKTLVNIDNCYLRSLNELVGYKISATDGESGKVSDFIVELGSWKVQYLIVKGGGWFSNKEYLVDTEWITDISWDNHEIAISLAKDQIQDSPEFNPSVPVNRAYEMKLYDYYGIPHRRVPVD